MSAPNLKEIEWAISELENQESSEKRYTLLAALYTCRSHLLEDTQAEPRISAYSGAAAQAKTIEQYGDSDFLRTVSSKKPERAWVVMDELMDTLRAVNRKVYDNVMRKLDRL